MFLLSGSFVLTSKIKKKERLPGLIDVGTSSAMFSTTERAGKKLGSGHK